MLAGGLYPFGVSVQDPRRTPGGWQGEGIDTLMAAHCISLLVAPAFGPAWLIDPAPKDLFVGGDVGQAPAVAAHPRFTVPMGLVDGLPAGLWFVWAAWSDAAPLGYGDASEQAVHARRPPQYLKHILLAGEGEP